MPTPAPHRARPRRNGLEWAVFALGAALTAGVVGFLAFDALRGGATERADLRVALGAPVAASGQVLVPVRVTNEGGAAGEAVRVEVCQAADDCAEVEFAYVPRASFREGAVGFADGGGPFRARVVSTLAP